MKNQIILPILFLLLLSTISSAQIKTLENGDKISWDGEYYDFRDASGLKMIKLWVPPNTRPVRGIFISGHGGGSGDSRNFARDENLRAFAMKLGFAVAGLHNFPGRRTYSDGAPVFFRVLDTFAEMGHHPELANIPFCMYGSSNGGSSTYGFVNYAPDRALCFLANVSAGYIPQEPVEKALEVPGIFIIGKFDALIGERGIRRTEEVVNYARQRGARWSRALELKGHEDGAAFDVYNKLVEQAVALQYPEDANPLSEAVKLNRIPEEEGWLADPESWASGLTKIDTYRDFKGDKKSAGWLLNKDMAFVYRSMATHHNPLEISVKEFDRTFNPNTDPGTMFSLGGPVMNPGDRISLSCNVQKFSDWQRIEFFDGADKLGEVRAGEDPEISILLDGDKAVYCLLAVATDSNGITRTSSPMHFFVRDPSRSWKVEKEVPGYEGRSFKGSDNYDETTEDLVVNPVDSTLIAYALSAGMERQFSSTDGRLSEFWSYFDDSHDFINLSQRANAAEGSAFNFVLTHDCNMQVKAAYGSDGIYLLFEINDDNDVAWPNSFTGTENEQFYMEFDAVDVLMDSRSVESISDEANRDMFLSRFYGLTFTTKQYQVACGIPEERPGGFKRSVADPWDFNSVFYSFAEAKNQLGTEIENIRTRPFYKAQEWFIPWSEYGGGLDEEPDAGSRLAFSAGFNDRDAGEHFPPGVNSSGGVVKGSNALRWIGKTDPWGSGKPPYAWGEILLGSPLKSDNK